MRITGSVGNQARLQFRGGVTDQSFGKRGLHVEITAHIRQTDLRHQKMLVLIHRPHQHSVGVNQFLCKPQEFLEQGRRIDKNILCDAFVADVVQGVNLGLQSVGALFLLEELPAENADSDQSEHRIDLLLRRPKGESDCHRQADGKQSSVGAKAGGTHGITLPRPPLAEIAKGKQYAINKTIKTGNRDQDIAGMWSKM